MKLLTREVLRRLETHPLGSQEGKGDQAVVLVKFFCGPYTCLITEAEQQADGDWLFYGKASLGDGWEWGYTLFSEIAALRLPPFGLGVERDLYLSADRTVGEEVKRLSA